MPPEAVWPPDTDDSALLLAISWGFLSIAIIVVALRFYARGILRPLLGWDDYTILASLVSCLHLSNGTHFH